MRSVPLANSPRGITTRPPKSRTCPAIRSSSVATNTACARAERTARS
jgi:hypothetical protein